MSFKRKTLRSFIIASMSLPITLGILEGFYFISISPTLAQTATSNQKQNIASKAEIVIGNPQVTYSSSSTLTISLPLTNQGKETASGVQLTEIQLQGGATPSTPASPNAFPATVGDIAVGQTVVVNVQFKSVDQRAGSKGLTVGKNYPLQVQGVFTSSNSSSKFKQTTVITIPSVSNDGPPTEEEESASSGQVSLKGVSTKGFNPISNTVRFELSGASFSAKPAAVTVLLNERVISDDLVQVTTNAVQFNTVLKEGRNHLLLYAEDAQGNLIYEEATLWAGSHTLQVRTVNENNQPLSGVTVTVKLGDDENVVAQAISIDGQAVFSNLPDHTLIVEGLVNGNIFGSRAATGTDGTVTVELLGFKESSSINNNDFSFGTSGWNIDTAPVKIVPHQEEDLTNAVSVQPSSLPLLVASADLKASPFFLTASTNNDLVLTTSGEGPQKISRTFDVQPGTKNVTVRYRFITSEFPAGYFGSKFNDSYSVTLRSLNGGNLTSDSQSMNGLGSATFDASGATTFREVSIPVNSQGDTVQVDVSVSNVGDGAYDSQIVLDSVNEKKLAITKLELRDIDNKGLDFLSTAAHTYFSGNTRVNGIITVQGANNDQLNLLVLEVIEGGKVVATANLAQKAQQTLFPPFGSDEQVEIATSQLLFELPSAQAANIDGTTNGTVSLRVRAKANSGEEVAKGVAPRQKLIHFTGTQRYGQRDENVGGDDWVKPSVKTVMEYFISLTWGDISNMNGGSFPPHSSHRTGNDIDGWFSGYNEINAATAATIISHLNDSTYGSRISLVFVTYDRSTGKPFWEAIKNVTLNDGRKAADIIRPVAGHATHFHWRVSD